MELIEELMQIVIGERGAKALGHVGMIQERIVVRHREHRVVSHNDQGAGARHDLAGAQRAQRFASVLQSGRAVHFKAAGTKCRRHVGIVVGRGQDHRSDIVTAGELDGEIGAEHGEVVYIEIDLIVIDGHFLEHRIVQRKRLVAADHDLIHDVDAGDVSEVIEQLLIIGFAFHLDDHHVVLFGQLVPFSESARALEHVIVVQADFDWPHIERNLTIVSQLEFFCKIHASSFRIAYRFATDVPRR